MSITSSSSSSSSICRKSSRSGEEREDWGGEAEGQEGWEQEAALDGFGKICKWSWRTGGRGCPLVKYSFVLICKLLLPHPLHLRIRITFVPNLQLLPEVSSSAAALHRQWLNWVPSAPKPLYITSHPCMQATQACRHPKCYNFCPLYSKLQLGTAKCHFLFAKLGTTHMALWIWLRWPYFGYSVILPLDGDRKQDKSVAELRLV